MAVKNFAFLLISILLISCNESKSKSTNAYIVNSGSEKDSSKVNKDFLKYHLDKIKLPEGFSISVYAKVDNARSMALSPDGTLFVGTRKNAVYAIPDKNGDGKGDEVYKIADGMDEPNGVAFKNGDLYVQTISTLYKMENIESNFKTVPPPVKIYDQYPTDKHHGWKFIAFGPDGKLYIPVGAPCNICEPEKPIYASITRINPDGSGLEIFAKGIRNTVGFDWDPVSGDLFFTDNGRDNMGDDIPNDELNRAPKAGMHFGYPYCHQGNILDPEFGKGKNCSDYTAPVELLGPHVAALGMRFNKQDHFPAEYKNAIFIAQHGSWNRSTPIGYRIAVVKRDAQGNTKKPEIFAEGWLQKSREVNGRPVDVQFDKDGNLFVSDDYAGLIYKISYNK